MDFPILTTERLTLRQTTMDDVAAVLFLRSDPVVNKYIDRPPANATTNVEEAEAFINKIIRGFENGENYNWCINLAGSNKMIGSICWWNFSEDKKKAELGYDLKPEFHNQGIMTEAVKAALDFGFGQVGLEEVDAYTHVDNAASIRLLEKFGFERNDEKVDEDNGDNVIFELTRKNYLELC